MRPSLLILSALASASAVFALPSTNGQPSIPDLPEGFFAGYNNPDGTSTLQFVDTHENFTFVPIPAPKPSGIEKRGQGKPDCWAWMGRLNTAGVDAGIRALKDRLYTIPIGLGQHSDWPPYFGYNNNGVYVYFCVNSGVDYLHWSFTYEELEWYSFWMDYFCGPYMSGYLLDDRYDIKNPYRLFGKAKSGTAVCQGNPRSPR
ncbi:hypothetical protein DE146DRAFT_619888 [Phaeosphaeria sp. MPI-PUGE-AT-0046c]|nr:hypothetical protein DE146DRAFT_619888 [Phaeosphaeria sp. MPI-PUGE-AT-0046c]